MGIGLIATAVGSVALVSVTCTSFRWQGAPIDLVALSWQVA